MRTIPSEAKAALVAGQFRVGTALEVLPDDDAPVRFWSGTGVLPIGGSDYRGVGLNGMATASSSAVGGSAAGLTLTLSGVDPEALALIDEAPLRDAPVTTLRLIFNAAGSRLLGYFRGSKGRADGLNREEVTPDPVKNTPGSAALKLQVEGPLRGFGRRGGRMRSDADQRLESGTDGAFKHVSYAATIELALGGKPPTRAADALPGTSGPVVGGGGGLVTSQTFGLQAD